MPLKILHCPCDAPLRPPGKLYSGHTAVAYQPRRIATLRTGRPPIIGASRAAYFFLGNYTGSRVLPALGTCRGASGGKTSPLSIAGTESRLDCLHRRV